MKRIRRTIRTSLFLSPILIGFFAVNLPPAQEPEAVLLFTGDIRGYLAPCGCAKPQIGGVKRLATIVRALVKNPNTFYVDIGNWTKAENRQDQLKAEALAEIFADIPATALNVGSYDARLGADYLRALSETTGGVFFSSNFQKEGALPSVTGKKVGALFFQGFLPQTEADSLGSEGKKIEEAIRDSETKGSHYVVLFAGSQKDAEALAKENPQIGLILYLQKGDPPEKPLKLGSTTLVGTPDRMRYLGRIELVNGEWKNLRFIELSADVQDDQIASRIYDSYLQRVSEEKLLEQLPRKSGSAKYVGSNKCATCHVNAYREWKKSKHAEALPTLEKTKNDRDPECVGCHVVGLDDISGFRNKKETPHLAGVGCENCHGPASAHIAKPSAPYGKAGEESCLTCHIPDHSPGFDFKTYWEKIKHGM